MHALLPQPDGTLTGVRVNALRPNAQARDLIELEIAGASVCWEPACRLALSILPMAAFENEMAHVAFHWAVGQMDKNRFDGPTNPDRLCDAMSRAKWPVGWTFDERQRFTEDLWSPRQYDTEAIRSLCEAKRDEHAAWKELVRVNQSWERNQVVQQLLRETSLPPPRSPPLQAAGLWDRFRR